MYEPLWNPWKRDRSWADVEGRYEQLLSTVAAAEAGTLIVYMTGAHRRHISTTMFERHGMELKRRVRVANREHAFGHF